MKTNFLKLFFLAICAIFGAQVFSAHPARAAWNLTFSDEFNASAWNSIETNIWNTVYPGGGTCGSGQGELEGYSSSAFTFPSPGTSGYLQINTGTPGVSSPGCPGTYKSGLITTSGRFSQAYGYWEMRAKFPTGGRSLASFLDSSISS